MLTPNDVVTLYCILSPIILACCAAMLFYFERPQINISFPKVLMCGKTDHLGTSIDIQGNGMLAVYGTQLPKDKYILVIEVGNDV